MIKPEDLHNRAVFQTPVDRTKQEPEETEDEHVKSRPGDPCPPSQPSALEDGERKGGNPAKAGE